jgi:(1->4)-alpha-D-glucan 1-alpha-D-glucosylmutase
MTAERAEGELAPVEPRPLLLATYRLQLHRGFDLRAAAAVVPYLRRLGVSHVYTSPLLQAAPGSTHGYDVVDHGRVSDDLGGEDAFHELVDALRDHGMGLVVDLVPNHMAIGAGRVNTWWWDVLENGQASRFAGAFDVFWRGGGVRGMGRVLLPILGSRYGAAIEAGELRLQRDDDRFELRYHEHAAPLSPRSLGPLVALAGERSGSDELLVLGEVLGALPASDGPLDGSARERRHRTKTVALRRVAELAAADERVGRAVDAVIAEVGSDPERLDALLEQQHYRLSYWRAAGTELDYRRFFDVVDLAGLRAEDPDVFDPSHALVVDWLRRGVVQGVRVDHPDGLADPEQYIRRLHEAGDGPWIVVEKILAPGERLPGSWLADGTTGYDFCERVTGLFVDPDSEEELTAVHASFTGRAAPFRDEEARAYRDVMRAVLGAEVDRVAELVRSVCEGQRRWRDVTALDARRAVMALVSGFRVYRTYVRPDADTVRESDRAVVLDAVEHAVTAAPDADPDLVRFLGEILTLQWRGPGAGEVVTRFQQLTGPVRAKAVEDTAFYRYSRFVARNEVGAEPAVWAVDPEAMHAHNAAMAARWPRSMLTTATHDTKRGEDVRARLLVLSEIPGVWAAAVRRWSDAAARHRADLVDRSTEYLWWQTLVGAFPLDAQRAVAYLRKATREAKEATSWTEPDDAYEAAVEQFVTGVLSDDEVMADVAAFVEAIDEPARTVSLAVTLLRLTSPGVPDTYQGCERWEHSLVDPDNRRPVDFASLAESLERALRTPVAELWSTRVDGVVKQRVVAAALEVRRRHPASFTDGAYEPVAAAGPQAHRALSFLRGDDVVVVVPRLTARLEGWGDTVVCLPPGRWTDRLGGRRFSGAVPVGDLLAEVPVALLTREGGGAEP